MNKDVKMFLIVVAAAVISDLIVQGGAYLMDKQRNSYDEEDPTYEEYIQATE